MDERGRQPGRQDRAVRPSGRSLPDAHGGRDAHAHRRGDGGRASGALLAGWPQDRLHLGPQRRREPVAHGCRWIEPSPVDLREGLFPGQRRILEPGRSLCHSPQAPPDRTWPGDRRGLDVPRGRRSGRAAGRDPGRSPPEGIGRGRLRPGRTQLLLQSGRDARPDLRIRPERQPGSLRHRALRHGVGRACPRHRRTGRRGAPDPVAGRAPAGLHSSRRRRDAAVRSRPADRP
ncbi:hypothetical protein D3C85_911400 [compost metagenome]